MIKLGPDHFRYTDEIGPRGLHVTCEKYVVIGETAQCWYIILEQWNNVFGGPHREEALKKNRKRVLKAGGEWGRRFAYTDKALALKSYKVRKDWQRRHAQLSLERAKAAIEYFGDKTIENEVPPDKLLIPCQYVQDMNWSEY